MEPVLPDPLDPVDRTATLVWVFDEADPAAIADGLATLEQTTPSMLLFGGENAPAPGSGDDPAFEALLAQVEGALEGRERRTDLAIELPALAPGDPGPFCFDRREPQADPAVAARAEALGLWLREHPRIHHVVLSFDIEPRSWTAECSCPACESELPLDLAVRLTTLLDAYAAPTAQEFRTLWFWDRATEDEPTAVDPSAYMDLALGTVNRDRHLPLRLVGKRGPDHPWGADNPRITDAAERRTAVDLDPAGTRFGPGGAPLFLLDDLYDRLRRHRAAAAVGWYVDLGGGGRRASGDLAGEANLRLIDRLFRDLEVDPDEVLAEHLSEAAGLPEGDDDDSGDGDDDFMELAAALRGSGRALDLATHPLGIEVADISDGVPASFPLEWLDPREGDPGWGGRWFELGTPDRATSAAIHQWGAEAEALVAEARAAVVDHQDRLQPDAFVRLDRGLRTLDVWVRGWRLAVDADTALRFVDAASAGPERTEAYAWLRSDAARLRALASELEAGSAAGTYGLPVPVAPTALVALAAAVEDIAGPGEAAERPFPVLTRVAHLQSGNRITVSWEVRPPSGGSIEWGTQWPVYDDGGNGEDEPAARWSAWREESLSPDQRVTFRACAPYDDEIGALTVCTSDHVLWTSR